MSAHYFGDEVKETKRYKLGKLLGAVDAPPPPDDGDAAQRQGRGLPALHGAARPRPLRGQGARQERQRKQADARDMMRRLVKEELRHVRRQAAVPRAPRLHRQVRALRPTRPTSTTRSPTYVREEMNRADRLPSEQGEGRRRNVVGFALTILQRRLASSPEAIYQSLERRRKRLEAKLERGAAAARGAQVKAEQATRCSTAGRLELDIEDLDDLDELPDEELEELEEQVVDQASAAQTIAELEARDRHARAASRSSPTRSAPPARDTKWERALRACCRTTAEMFDANGDRRKLIVFTEHRDTLNYLVEQIRTVLGRPEAVVAIHGGMRPRGAPRGAGVRSRRTRTSSCSSPPTPRARASTSSAPT